MRERRCDARLGSPPSGAVACSPRTVRVRMLTRVSSFRPTRLGGHGALFVKLAIVSTPFLPVPPRGYGGTELVIHELVRELEQRGHAVTLFATGDSQARDLRCGRPTTRPS